MTFKENKPIYLQIADRIMDEILQDRYAEEARIPSVREYAAEVEVNANTMVRSYDYLQSQDIIFNRRGIGYFVQTEAKARIQALRKEVFLRDDLPELFRLMRLLGISMEEIARLYENYCSE